MAEKSGGSKKTALDNDCSGAPFLSRGSSSHLYGACERNEQSADGESQLPAERETPVFTRIDPFTVNLADDRYGSRLLYTGITLRVGNEESKAIIEEHMPQVRSRLLILYSQASKPVNLPPQKVRSS